MKNVVLAGLAAASAWGIRRHRQIRSVTPELRTASLYVPLFVDNRLSLFIGRRMFGGSTEPRPGVVLTTVAGTTKTPEVLVYESTSRTRPSGALLWIHGGGLVLGRPETDHAWCSRIADELDILVVSVRYRLAPEHPFPAGLNDCASALDWIHDRADELGVDPARIAVGGASAGGGLAAALCQRAHDEGRVSIAFQLLEYPMLDDRTTLNRERNIRSVFGWTPRSNRFGWTSYLGFRPGRHSPPPYAVPARRADLSGLPPAWIGVGDLDLFLNEDLEYARRLRSAGVTCELEVVPGMYHGADVTLDATSPMMEDFRRRMVDALASRSPRTVVRRTAPPPVRRSRRQPTTSSTRWQWTLPVRGQVSTALRMIPTPSGIRSRYGSVDPGSVLRARRKSSDTLQLPHRSETSERVLRIGYFEQ